MAEPNEKKWACPKCGADANKHGKGGGEKCKDRFGTMRECSGFICECDDEMNMDDHGESFATPCTNAVCYHCGWEGTFPIPPKGLEPWEKKALAAGWAPPEKRKKELGL